MAKNRLPHQSQGEGDAPLARAPYNFIPLVQGEPLTGEIIPHDRYHRARHTGYFDVSLETVTPLFVRGMITDEELTQGKEAKDQPEPFVLDGKPVIPGSSLRGMIRNLVEIITFGKMNFVSDNKLVYRAIYYADALANTYRGITTDVLGNKEFMYPSSRMHGGYLQKGDSESGWVIQPAKAPYGESIALVDRQDVLSAGISESPKLKLHWVSVKPATTRIVHTGKEGVQLHIAQANGISLKTGSGYEPATLIISNTVGKIGDKGSNRRWYPAIYEADPAAEPIPIPQRVWDDFSKDRDLNRGIANRKLQNPGDVLFYLLDSRGELIFFGPTMFFRIPYENSVGGLIYDNPLDPNFTDYADAMFGYVSERGGKEKRDPVAYAGRISVTSATLIEGQTDVFYDEQRELRRTPGSPKPTTFQHYLEQPSGTNTSKQNLHHYGKPEAKIRGHKLYWRQNVNIEHLKNGNTDGSKENIETKFRPVKEGTTFAFRVYFENLTDAELGALAWTLTLDGDENLYHMLGMGKPYGLGVTKLMSSLVITDRDARHHTLFDGSGAWYTAAEEQAADTYIQAFKQALNAYGTDFDTDERIDQLKAMLRLYDPDPELFSYMQIERMIDGEKVNEYKNRPALPYPTGVEETYKKKRGEQRRLEQQKELENQIKTKRQLEVGDVIRGVVFDGGSNDIWFGPQQVKVLGKWIDLTWLGFQVDYEAQIPKDKVMKQRNEGAKVCAQILEIVDGDPITLICEQLDC
jgi:CRISPR-associated protein (TIGR03986 family)